MRLIVLRGPSPAGPFDLGPGTNHAGRGPECEVFLPSKRVSRRHAVFQIIDGQVEVRDLDSHNGILSADGTRVSQLMLSPGERVQVGDYLLRLEGPTDDLLLEEEEDDDVLLDDETAESALPARPATTPNPPPNPQQRMAAAPVPPPPALPFPASGGFGSRPGRGLPPDPSRSMIAEPDETRSDIAPPPPWNPSKPANAVPARPPAADPGESRGAAPPKPAEAPRGAAGPTLAPLPFGRDLVIHARSSTLRSARAAACRSCGCAYHSRSWPRS
ncbi:MAG: FHA domain-containing protein, partial [Pseudomonadota bacterium]|nr:FHA domain-containing protein [Pseudomonadota bacterium]